MSLLNPRRLAPALLWLLLISGCSDDDTPPTPPPEIPKNTSSYTAALPYFAAIPALNNRYTNI